MSEFWVSLIAMILSGMIFSFLLHILNTRVWGVFVPIQKDIAKLSKSTRRILKLSGNLLAILITVLLEIILGSSRGEFGIILGFLMALVDTCFNDNIVENIIEGKEQY